MMNEMNDENDINKIVSMEYPRLGEERSSEARNRDCQKGNVPRHLE